jgi:adenylate cyclase
LANAAFALAYFGEDIGAMMALVDRALLLNPSFARGWALSANIRVWAGTHDTAIQHVGVGLRLSPRARVGSSLCVLGMAQFFCRRFDEAVAELLLAIQEDPSHPPSYWHLASSYAHMGRLEEAREIVRRLRHITPVVMPSIIPLRNVEDRELFLSGLRLVAGEPG